MAQPFCVIGNSYHTKRFAGMQYAQKRRRKMYYFVENDVEGLFFGVKSDIIINS